MAFCPNCGAEVKSDQRFCASCGHPIAHQNETVVDSDYSANDSSTQAQATAQSAAFSTGEIPSIPASYTQNDTTISMPPVSAGPTAGQPYYRGSAYVSPSVPSPAPQSKKWPIAIAAVSVLAIAGILIAVLFGTGVIKAGSDSSTDNATQQPAQQSTAPQEHQSTQSEPADQDGTAQDSAQNQPTTPQETQPTAEEGNVATPDRAEMELYDELAAFYEDLNMYNDKISEAATEFNNTYASNNYHTRQKNAANVNRLMGDLQETYDRLLSVKVPVSSINADTYSAMETCYYDCTKRISVISEAWDISLMYEEPKYFKDEILEPISRDNDGSTNRYYAEFKSTFPDAKPVKPTA